MRLSLNYLRDEQPLVKHIESKSQLNRLNDRAGRLLAILRNLYSDRPKKRIPHASSLAPFRPLAPCHSPPCDPCASRRYGFRGGRHLVPPRSHPWHLARLASR